MSSYRKNLLVGVTVLGALLALAWMILKFGDKPAALFIEPRLQVQFTSDRADGIADGSSVLYRGVNVGRIAKVSRDADSIHVTIDAEVDVKPPLPANIEGLIRSQGLIGSAASLNLELTGPTPQGTLQAGTKLKARFVGLDILPPEFAELAGELRATSKQFRESNIVLHVDETVKSIQTFVSDPKLRGDLQAAVANFRSASETANRIGANIEKVSGSLQKVSDEAGATVASARTTIEKTGAHVDDVAKQLNDRLQQIAKVLEGVQSITAKIDKGNGTAGLLVNDPKLYESLVDSARELNATISDFKRLVEQWEQEGVSFKLK